MHNQYKTLVWIGIIFCMYIGLLGISYIYKLGWLALFTEIGMVLCACMALINSFKHTWYSKLFWLVMCAAFLFIYVDKNYRIHIMLEQMVGSYGYIVVGTIYMLTFLIILGLFLPYHIEELHTAPLWVMLLYFAFIVKGIALLSDIVFRNSIEDYFEAFSIFFFMSSFVVARWRGLHENSTISS